MSKKGAIIHLMKSDVFDTRYVNVSGDTMTGDLTPGGRVIVPMGEASYFSATGTAISIASASDGSTNMVPIAVTSTDTSDYEFDNGGSNIGRIRYTGTTTKMFHVACSMSFGGGNADLFVIGIAKDGTTITASKIQRKMGAGGDIGSTAMHVMTELTTNQYLEVYIGNMTDTDNPTVYSLNLFAMGM